MVLVPIAGDFGGRKVVSASLAISFFKALDIVENQAKVCGPCIYVMKVPVGHIAAE